MRNDESMQVITDEMVQEAMRMLQRASIDLGTPERSTTPRFLTVDRTYKFLGREHRLHAEAEVSAYVRTDGKPSRTYMTLRLDPDEGMLDVNIAFTSRNAEMAIAAVRFLHEKQERDGWPIRRVVLSQKT